jgi:hypothetical protein
MCTLGHRSNTSSDSAISPSALSLSTIITDTDCYRKQRWKRRQRSRFWLNYVDRPRPHRPGCHLALLRMNEWQWIVMTRKRRQLKM